MICRKFGLFIRILLIGVLIFWIIQYHSHGGKGPFPWGTQWANSDVYKWRVLERQLYSTEFSTVAKVLNKKDGHPYSNELSSHQSEHDDANIPIVPCISADKHLLVLSAAASRIRYGMTLTFIMVFADDLKVVLLKGTDIDPISPRFLELWCVFADGSTTPAYSYDHITHLERSSFAECPLSSFAMNELWIHRRTLRVYLVSQVNKTSRDSIVKALVTVPDPFPSQLKESQYQLALCTSSLHDKAEFLSL